MAATGAFLMAVDKQSGEVLLSWTEEYEGAGYGPMDLVARTSRGFGGKGGAWVSRRDLRAFATAALEYPLDARNLPALEGGLGGLETGDYRCLASLQVRQVTSAGQLVVELFLADDVTDDRKGPFGLEQSATIVLPTTYQRLREFGEAIRTMADHLGGIASIGEEVLRR